MTTLNERKRLFRAAWDELDGQEPIDQLARASMAASVQGDPEMEALVAELAAPAQAEFEARITGDSVVDHETAAAPLGKFMTRAAESVNAVSKSINPRIRRLGDRLRITAPAMGSVRVVMRVPVVGPEGGIEPGPSVESQALDLIVTLMEQAERDVLGTDSALTAAVQNLVPSARNRVRLLADTVDRAGWEIDGSLARKGAPLRRIHLSRRGAARLRDELARTEDVEPRRVRITGHIDGQLRTESLMQFIPDDGQKFKAMVTDADLMDRVAHLAADAEQQVAGLFDVYEQIPSGQQTYTKRSFHLVAIEAIESPQQPELPKRKM